MFVPYSTTCSLTNKMRKDIQCSSVLYHNSLPGDDLSRKTIVWQELNGTSSIIEDVGDDSLACVSGGPLSASISQWQLSSSDEDTTK